MVKDGVGLVICQKVIHPALKENQVVAVERFGIAMMESLKEMTEVINHALFVSKHSHKKKQLRIAQIAVVSSNFFRPAFSVVEL
ncbi:UNVERIFIED_CONTAM: hypothetical protein K2H54_004105 [Gekko kuhli]